MSPANLAGAPGAFWGLHAVQVAKLGGFWGLHAVRIAKPGGFRGLHAVRVAKRGWVIPSCVVFLLSVILDL